ncbi:hypothetical protein [Proteiniclasticum sp.]|uniref:hypothetical protein n=1 Tax=Proteiniclasticum sp. TaxID=2053595 RepID=UPI0028A1D44D|nr:hypothetical protein [Proteiniclasticum sp.]
MMFIPIVLIAGLFYILTKDNKVNLTKDSKDPQNRLKERFIRGEIDEQTYYKMKSVIDED